jgi:hypothetical protein
VALAKDLARYVPSSVMLVLHNLELTPPTFVRARRLQRLFPGPSSCPYPSLSFPAPSLLPCLIPFSAAICCAQLIGLIVMILGGVASSGAFSSVAGKSWTVGIAMIGMLIFILGLVGALGAHTKNRVILMLVGDGCE